MVNLFLFINDTKLQFDSAIRKDFSELDKKIRRTDQKVVSLMEANKIVS